MTALDYAVERSHRETVKALRQALELQVLVPCSTVHFEHSHHSLLHCRQCKVTLHSRPHHKVPPQPLVICGNDGKCAPTGVLQDQQLGTVQSPFSVTSAVDQLQLARESTPPVLFSSIPALTDQVRAPVDDRSLVKILAVMLYLLILLYNSSSTPYFGNSLTRCSQFS